MLLRVEKKCRSSRSTSATGAPQLSVWSGSRAKMARSRHYQLDGIFCFNDPSAQGAMRAILDAGLRLPEDVAGVGFENLSYSDFLRVPLSSVGQGAQSMDKSAAELALKIACKKESSERQAELISPRMVMRSSSVRFRKAPLKS